MNRLFPSLAFSSAALLLSLEARTQDSVIRQAALNQTVRSMLSQKRGLAATADGRLWALVHFNDGKASAGDASRQLLLYLSADAGKTWQQVSQVRTKGAIYGSLVVDPDGYTLHLAWYASNGKANPSRPGSYLYSVYHGSYDTRTGKWSGTADTVIAQAKSDREQFYQPDIEVTSSGTLALSFYNRYVTPTGWGGPAGSWNGYLTWNKGKGWATPQRINVDTFGPHADLQANGETIHIAYRTNQGLYGTRYRSFDTITGKFGAEIPIPIPKGATTKINGNVNCIAVRPNGDVYVLYGRDAREVSTTAGQIRYAFMKAGGTSFTADYKVADYIPGTGEKKIGGNNTHYHFTLSTDGRNVVAFYGVRNATKSEQFENLYMRILLPTGPTPEIPVRKGGRKNQYKILCSHRDTTGRHTLLLTYSDLSAIGTLTGGRAVMLNLSKGLSVRHGLGCRGSLSKTPDFMTADVPVLGQSLGIEITNQPGSTFGVMFLGLNDKQLGAIPLPLGLAGLGMPGCFLYQDLLVILGYPVNALGEFKIGFPLPTDPKLLGLPLFWQAFVSAPGANPGKAVMSNGLSTIPQ